MRNSIGIIPLALAGLFSLGAHAATGIEVHAATQVDCMPNPSIETLDKETVYEDGKLKFGRLVTCSVIEGQPVPTQSKFFGQLVAGPVPNSYLLTWDGLQVTAPDGSIAWTYAGDSLSSVKSGSDVVRVTFKQDVHVGPFNN